MKSTPLIIINALILTLLFGCAGKEGQKTTTKIVVGNIASLASQTGGVMIYGNNPTTGENFGQVFSGAPMVLSNGFWEFLVISYDGNGVNQILEGALRCGRGQAELSGGDTTVSLELSTTTCNEPIFGTTGSKDGTGQPFPLTLWSCMNPEAVDNRDSGGCQKGVAGSHRIILPAFDSFGPTSEALVSACIPHGATADQMSPVRIPFFELGFGSIPFQVRSFTDSGCLSPADVYTFPDGHKTPSFPQYGTALSEAGLSNNVYLFKSPCATAQFGSGATPFSFVDENSNTIYLICNENQFSGYVSTSPTLIYALGRDLDFGGANLPGPLINANFTGQFYGNGKEIRNLTIDCSGVSTGCGIFKDLSPTGGVDVVNDLKLFNVTVNTSSTSSIVGALTGTLRNGSRIRNLNATGISVNVADGANTIGGLVGSIPTSGGGIESSKISNVMVNLERGTSIGGAIGATADNAFVRNSLFENITFNQMAESTTGSTGVGGVVGSTTGSATPLEFWDIFANGISMGSASFPIEIASGVGGILGTANGARFNRVGVVGTMDIEARATILNAGGVVGSFTGNPDLRHILSEVNVNAAHGATGPRVGGVIGGIDNTIGSMVSRVRNIGDVNCIGSCGGIVGYAVTGGPTGTYSELLNLGNITATTNNVGGLIGAGSSLSITDSVNRGNISGVLSLGGIIGVATSNVAISKSINGGDITVAATGTGGGLIGTISAAGINCVSSVAYGTVAGAGTIKEMIGDPVAAPTVTDCFYLDQSLSETYGSAAAFVDLTDPASTVLTSASTPFSTLLDFAGNSVFIADTNGIVTSFEVSMNKLGVNFTGNSYDPFPIFNETEWNSIGDDPFLMSMDFRLENDLFFGDGLGAYFTFMPIGSPTSCYSGQFMGNDRSLNHISLDESGGGTSSLGVFRSLCYDPSEFTTAEVDHYDEFNGIDYFLYINDAHFVSDTYNTGVLAGEVEDFNSGSHFGTEAITLYGIVIGESSATTAGSGNAGAIAGTVNFVNGNSEIENISVSFTDVTVSSTGNAGGLVGHFFGAPSTPPEQNAFNLLYFTNGTVTSSGRAGGAIGNVSNPNVGVTRVLISDSTISGQTSVGGLIGLILDGGPEVVESVVKYSTIADGASGAAVGGLVGDAQLTTLPSLVKGSYAFDINLIGSGTLGGIVGNATNAGGGNLVVEANYAVVTSVTGGGTFAGIDATPSPTSAGSLDSYYYFDGFAHGSIGVALADVSYINNGLFVPDLMLGTEFLLYGLDHPQRPFEIFPELFLE